MAIYNFSVVRILSTLHFLRDDPVADIYILQSIRQVDVFRRPRASIVVLLTPIVFVLVSVVIAEVLGYGSVVEGGGGVRAVPPVDGARSVVAATVCSCHFGVFVETGR